MRKWAFLLGVVASAGVAAVVVSLALRRAGEELAGEEIPELIADCFDRVHRIEAELRRLTPVLESAD